MRLAESISAYVSKRRIAGLQFVSSETILKAFSRHCGMIEISELVPQHVDSFLFEGPPLKSVTIASKFSVVKCFCEHLARNGEIQFLQLAAPGKSNALRLPFIYTLQELRSLLRATDECQCGSTVFAAETFRLLIVILYSTGAGLGETLALTRQHISLRCGQIEFAGGQKRMRRKVPIGRALKAELSTYLADGAVGNTNARVFQRIDGKPLSQHYLASRFRRLGKLAVLPHAPQGGPRLQDLRYTFAVHSLTSWLRSKRDVNSLLPALSTYMGYSDLTATERFCALTPERFRAELEKLSPSAVAPIPAFEAETNRTKAEPRSADEP